MRLYAAAMLAGVMLSACASGQSPGSVAVPRTGAGTQDNAVAIGVAAGPDVASLDIGEDAARRGLIAFRSSCSAVTKRIDRSGLTKTGDWAASCEAAQNTADAGARAFFSAWFEAVQVGPGAAFATGYYEPDIAGALVPSAAYPVPVYRLPDDLVEVDLGRFSPALEGKRVRGRVSAGQLVPYFDRAEIEGGALAGRGLELAWAADPIEMFFLQVQGSGRLNLPDGSSIRIGYAGQNGRDYTGIGRLMRQRNMLGDDATSMEGIMSVLRQSPDGGRALMNENKSFVFFRVLKGPGPIGAIGVPVGARASVAADPAFVPLGAPVFLALDNADASGLWIAQDTGGAIKGANRFDTFWGAGPDARRIAGGMSARGSALLLLPKGSLARLAAGAGTTP